MAERPAVNASPLIFLADADLLHLLRLAGDEVIVPDVFADEIRRRGPADVTARALEQTSWLLITKAPEVPPIIQRQNWKGVTMDIVYDCCCGIDVHAKTAVACLIKNGKKETRTYSTMTDDLLRLRDWLTSEGCRHVAIESTGVYWKPVFNILEGSLEVILVNPREAKGYKARKTDVIDAEWLADLLRHNLLKPSFIPPRPIRELRELTRYRESLVRDRTALANRIQKLVESGNKLGQVATDALGVSGKLMLRALAGGETDAEKMSEIARAKLKRKKGDLKRALEGRLTQAQRWVLRELLDQYDRADAAIKRVEERIRQEVEKSEDPFGVFSGQMIL